MSTSLSIQQLRSDFATVFGTEADHTFFSPGRINLIGEHTDYNGGHVFPAAISLGTYGVARKRDDNLLRFYSANTKETGCFTGSSEIKRFCSALRWRYSSSGKKDGV